jgi:hypothetical protein
MKMILSRTAFLLGITSFSFAIVSRASTAAAPQTFSGATPLEWPVRLADSEMARQAKWDYSVGVFTLSLLKLNGQLNNALCHFHDECHRLVHPCRN